MTDTTSAADAAVLQRRRFLRGGALLAAAAGGAVTASAGSVLPAQAADTDVLSASFGIPPQRLVDTRTADGRELIVASSGSAFDSKHRLKKYAWIDVAVFPVDEDIAAAPPSRASWSTTTTACASSASTPGRRPRRPRPHGRVRADPAGQRHRRPYGCPCVEAGRRRPRGEGGEVAAAVPVAPGAGAPR